MRKIDRESGQILIMVAISLTVLLGFVGFATDVGVLLHEKRELQTAADSAALGGATEALIEGTPTTVTGGIATAALNDAALNGFTATSNGVLDTSTGVTVTINVAPNITVSTFNTPGYVQAIVSQKSNNIFMSLFGAGSTPVAAAAIASDTISSDECVDVTNPGSAANPAYSAGGSSNLETSCAVFVNGNIGLSGAASITTNGNTTNTKVEASGTVSGGSSSWAQNVPPIPNPLAYLSSSAYQPTVTTTGSGKSAVTTCTAPAGSGLTCYYDYNGGALGSGATPIGGDTPGTLPSNGFFYFDESTGPTVSGSISGSGVVLYLSGTSMPFDLETNSTVDLTPPSSGTLANVLLDAPYIGGTTTCSNGVGNNKGNPGEIALDFGSSNTTFNGIVYAPNAQLFGQDQGASTTINLDLIIGNICMSSSTFQIGGITPDNPIKTVGLVY